MGGVREQVECADLFQRVAVVDQRADVTRQRRDIARYIEQTRRLHSQNALHRLARHARPRGIDDERCGCRSRGAAQEILDAGAFDARALGQWPCVFFEVVPADRITLHKGEVASSCRGERQTKEPEAAPWRLGFLS